MLALFVQIHPENMRRSLTHDMLATDLAEYLVRKGVSGRTLYCSLLSQEAATDADSSISAQIPFRETHHISGSAVKLAETRKCSIADLSVEDFKKLNNKFEEDVKDVFSFETSVERRDVVGGTSRRAVLEQIDSITKIIAA